MPALRNRMSPVMALRPVHGVIGLVATVLACWFAGAIAREQALAALAEQTRTDAAINSAWIGAVLDRQRALPLILAHDPDLRTVLTNPVPADIAALNDKFAHLAQGTGASVIYLMDHSGQALVASNWDQPDSFIGTSFQFRPYFSQALQQGADEYFALGTVSKRPGLYISQRVDGPADPLGVVTAKLEVASIEARWQRDSRPIIVTDARGIVLFSGIPEWRYHSISALSPEMAQQIRASRQFGDSKLQPLAFTIAGDLSRDSTEIRALLPKASRIENFVMVEAAVPNTNWAIHILTPLAPEVTVRVVRARLLALALLLSLAAAAAMLVHRRREADRRAEDARHTQQELENRVARRTADLLAVTENLQAEITSHRNTEAALHHAQQDLVHANRLAILGQVAAGVAHEVNQPLAAIRTYSENARLLIARHDSTTAASNLDEIIALTDRIAAITGELRGFARKSHQPPQPVSLQAVISGALLLVRNRIIGRKYPFVIADIPEGLQVCGNQIRLEQVLINLFQNALDAIDERGDDGRISIAIEECGPTVRLAVADNGVGISPHVLASLFTPFITTKPKGLGLGLVIAREILADYQGAISAVSDSGGSIFTIELRKA